MGRSSLAAQRRDAAYKHRILTFVLRCQRGQRGTWRAGEAQRCALPSTMTCRKRFPQLIQSQRLTRPGEALTAADAGGDQVSGSSTKTAENQVSAEKNVSRARLPRSSCPPSGPASRSPSRAYPQKPPFHSVTATGWHCQEGRSRVQQRNGCLWQVDWLDDTRCTANPSRSASSEEITST